MIEDKVKQLLTVRFPPYPHNEQYFELYKLIQSNHQTISAESLDALGTSPIEALNNLYYAIGAKKQVALIKEKMLVRRLTEKEIIKLT